MLIWVQCSEKSCRNGDIQNLMRLFTTKFVADHFSLPAYYIGTVVNVSTTSIQKVNPFHVASTI